MHAAEQVLLAERTAGAESAAAWTRLSAVGASALGMVAVLLGGRFMLRAAAARARAERGVRAANAELARANAELEAFSYSVSHDLRAPLRAIDGFSRAVEEDHGRDLPPAAREDLARVRAAAGRMGRLIDDLLRLSKVGRQEMRRVEVDVSALAAGVAAELRRAEPGRSVEVVVHEGLRARADPGLVGVILQNLIGNAWKFTGGTPGARIEVGAEDPEREGVRRGGGHGGDGRAFYVRDNGAGFDPAYAERLFTPFRRLHRAEDFPGTGIGLATVRRAVQRQGGEVWAEGSPGRGATFWFTLGRRHDAPEEVTRDEGEDRAAGG
jgi:signal transduction histidine kinase